MKMANIKLYKIYLQNVPQNFHATTPPKRIVIWKKVHKIKSNGFTLTFCVFKNPFFFYINVVLYSP